MSNYIPKNHKGDRAPSNHHSGTAEILEVTQLLEAANIPCCIVGVKALRYFGAGRVDEEWDVCVPDDQLDAATQLFETAPLNARFERVQPPDPMPVSLRHRFPTFKLKGVIFYFLLAPSSDCFIDPRPEFCERSQMGISYPQDVYFARSLLAKQDGADLEDFVDAHNSSVEWGESNLNLPELQAQGTQYAVRKNEQITSDGRLPVLLQVNCDFAAEWRRTVEGKDGRIEPLKQGRYLTRWRSKARPVDPRLPDPKGRNKFRDYV